MPAIVGALIVGGLEAAGVGGVAGFSLGSTTIFGVSLTTILGGATLLAGTVAVGFLTKPTVTPQDGHQALKQAIPPRIGAYGKYQATGGNSSSSHSLSGDVTANSGPTGGNRIAGSYMAYEVQNGISYDVMALVSGRIGGFYKFYLHDDEIAFLGGGVPNGTTKYVAAGTDKRYGLGPTTVGIATRLGADAETPYSEVVSALAAKDIWTNDHRGDGIASAMLISNKVPENKFLQTYPHGLPKLSAVVDGYPVWDFREGSQDPDDPSTWEVSDNPVLGIVDYLTHPDHGMGLDREQMITPVLALLEVEADKCDALVAKKTGTEKRYRCNTWYNFDNDPSEIIADFLASCDGWIQIDGNGNLALKVGVYEADAGDPITDKHVLSFAIDYGLADEELVNELTLGFTSPDHDYTTVPGQVWRNEASISEAGRVRSRPFSPKGVQSHSQLRRLAKRFDARLNAPVRGQMTTTLFGLTKQGKRWINLAYLFFAETSDCVVEVRRMQTNLVAGTCTFDWVLIDPATIDAWDPATEEGTAPIKPKKDIPQPYTPRLVFNDERNSTYLPVI